MAVLKKLFRTILKNNLNRMAGAQAKIADYAAFRKVLDNATNIVVLTGAGVSAESGIGTFRDSSGLWRTHNITDLASIQAFQTNPSLVWEFYEWRRTIAFAAKPNNVPLVEFEKKCIEQKKQFVLITQNVDGLHVVAGSQNVLEIHGALRKVVCTKCKLVAENTSTPICEALRGRGDPKGKSTSDIPVSDLPKCKSCSGLLRPYIVWFGENLDETILNKCHEALQNCNLFLVIGTSAIVYPAAGFIPFVQDLYVPVAEFNIEAVSSVEFNFIGPCSTTLPKALGVNIKN